MSHRGRCQPPPPPASSCGPGWQPRTCSYQNDRGSRCQTAAAREGPVREGSGNSVQLSRSKPSIITSQASLDSYGLDALHLEFVQGIRKDDPLIPQCLDTIAASFSSDKSSGSDFYAGLDPEVQKLFWRLLAQECLSAASNDEKPMMLLRGGEAAALCVLWHPPTSPWDMKDASYWPLLTPEARDCFESCHSATGEWFNACLSLYEQQGPFYSLEFLACGVMSQGRGLASTLLSSLTSRADKEGKYTFLVATNARLMQWYSARFGFVLKKESIFERMEGGVAYYASLFYMERPPNQQQK